ncbi:unnamed protein product [Diabrotica balteata]|uniref:Uncharacterized protein n=1 Tax=Diabrotica balteata TaxID=107213 RepID=A0A9N9T4W9_DIABA|nr:unnamed protein product [Diabrotica balteata]
MIISKENITRANLYVNEMRIDRVSQYNYLGTIINESWDNTEEIKCRIGKAKSAFLTISSVFKSRILSASVLSINVDIEGGNSIKSSGF